MPALLLPLMMILKRLSSKEMPLADYFYYQYCRLAKFEHLASSAPSAIRLIFFRSPLRCYSNDYFSTAVFAAAADAANALWSLWPRCVSQSRANGLSSANNRFIPEDKSIFVALTFLLFIVLFNVLEIIPKNSKIYFVQYFRNLKDSK